MPSYNKLCEVLGLASRSAVAKVLNRLRAEGYLSRTPDGVWVPDKLFFASPRAPAPSFIGAAGGSAGGRWPLFAHGVKAGFPSPADDYLEGRISLDEYLIRNKEATFFLRVEGDSMEGEGIFDGDILVVDKSLTPEHGSVVIAVLEGEFTVKQFIRSGGGVLLRAANPKYADIMVGDEQALEVWGVVRWAIHKV
ncbi:MAG: peptidase S24 [Deltaproteobacteria bacterium]|nr:MAG: peptidase S24 [Deltaproteobacteria bacterium]